MTASEFVQAIKSFGNTSFTEEQLRQKVLEIAGNDKNFVRYFWDYERREITGARIVDLGNGQYKATFTERASKTREKSKKKKESKPRLEEQLGVNKLTYGPISDDDALKIFIYTLNKFKELATTRCKIPVNRTLIYFNNPDAVFLTPPDYKKAPISFVFKQIAFHAQNGQVIDNVIRWGENEGKINALTNSYDPTKPLSKTKKQFVDSLKGLTKNGKKVAGDYYECLSDTREFLKNKKTPLDVYNDLIYKASTPLDFVGNVRNHIGKRLGNALTFDFIKEFGKIYGYSRLDFPKPDLHIKRTTAFALIPNMGSSPGGYLSTHKTTDFDANALDPMETIKEFVRLMNSARKGYVKNGGKHVTKLTNYVMDKMVFIICSGKLYLHGIENRLAFGADYTRGLADKDYGKINIAMEMPLLESFLGRIL